MDTIFMNLQNSRTSEYYVLVLKLTDKLDLRRGQKSVALLNLGIYYTWKNIKSSNNSNKFNNLLQNGVRNLNYQMDHIQYQIFKIILSIFLRSIVKMLIIHHPSILELLTPETMKLLGSSESKDKNSENVPHLEVVELVLVHCSLVNNDYQQDSTILYKSIPNKLFGSF